MSLNWRDHDNGSCELWGVCLYAFQAASFSKGCKVEETFQPATSKVCFVNEWTDVWGYIWGYVKDHLADTNLAVKVLAEFQWFEVKRDSGDFLILMLPPVSAVSYFRRIHAVSCRFIFSTSLQQMKRNLSTLQNLILIWVLKTFHYCS